MQDSNGINLQDLKENNLSLVIRSIRSDEQCSRVSLVRSTGLKQATITKIVNQLMQWGLVTENESLSNALGRKPIRLALNSDRFLVYAVRINRDYIHAAVYDIAGKCYIRKERSINAADGAHAALNSLKRMLVEAGQGLPTPPMAIGVALPGPFDATSTRIALMTSFPGWAEIDIVQELQEHFSLPVFLEHDANCGALAEQWYGNHGDCRNMLYVLCDKGVGAGLILNGSIYRGVQGFAGEIGHVSINMYGPVCECGNRGCMELYCNTIALENEYKRLVMESGAASEEEIFLPAEAIMRQVRENSDDCASRAYRRVVTYLAFGTVGIINAINPQAVVFADKITQGGPVFLGIVNEVFEKHLLVNMRKNLEVAVSDIKDDPMLLGAGVVAYDQLFAFPSKYFGTEPGGPAASERRGD